MHIYIYRYTYIYIYIYIKTCLNILKTILYITIYMLEVTKIYIATRFKTADRKSYSQFTLELPKTVKMPDATIAYINDIVLPVP